MKYRFLENFLFPPTWLSSATLAERLPNKTILITGATYGIGEALAQLLAPTGATLILLARTASKLKMLQKELTKQGATVIIYSLDLRDKAALKECLESLTMPIDIVVSNAGQSIRRPLWESLDRLHDFERTMSLNYFAPVQMLLHLMPQLEKNKGQIIHISAVNVLLLPAPYWAAYQASKTAFDQWFRAVLPELNARGIATTSIYLPLVKTRMIAPTKAYKNVPAMSPQQVAKIIAKTILNRASQYRPWWLIFGQIASFFFRKPWEYFWTRYLRYLYQKKN